MDLRHGATYSSLRSVAWAHGSQSVLQDFEMNATRRWQRAFGKYVPIVNPEWEHNVYAAPSSTGDEVKDGVGIVDLLLLVARCHRDGRLSSDVRSRVKGRLLQGEAHKSAFVAQLCDELNAIDSNEGREARFLELCQGLH